MSEGQVDGAGGWLLSHRAEFSDRLPSGGGLSLLVPVSVRPARPWGRGGDLDLGCKYQVSPICPGGPRGSGERWAGWGRGCPSSLVPLQPPPLHGPHALHLSPAVPSAELLSSHLRGGWGAPTSQAPSLEEGPGAHPSAARTSSSSGAPPPAWGPQGARTTPSLTPSLTPSCLAPGHRRPPAPVTASLSIPPTGPSLPRSCPSGFLGAPDSSRSFWT